MTNYQFRADWRGKLILQRKVMYRRWYGDKYFEWRDATTEDLKDYYEQLHKIQKPCACQEQRRLPNAECG